MRRYILCSMDDSPNADIKKDQEVFSARYWGFLSKPVVV